MATDYTTAAAQLRLLIADLDDDAQVLTDDQVAGYLGMYGLTAAQAGAPLPQVKRAAADALDAIASSEALVSKKIRTQAGVSTDGPAVAAALRAHAKELRAQADADEDDDADVAVLEFQPYPRGL